MSGVSSEVVCCSVDSKNIRYERFYASPICVLI